MITSGPTIVNMYIWPESTPLAYYTGTFAVQPRPDECGYLLGDRVGDSGVDESMGRNPVDRRRKDDVCAHISLFVCFRDEKIDVSMGGSVRDGLDLVDAEVVVDRVRCIFSPGIVR